MTKEITEAVIWKMLESVSDPEIPVLSVVDLGVVREVHQLENQKWYVKITPTYTGCPATHVMERDIIDCLKNNGVDAHVEITLSPAWTTDWLSEEGRRKLKEYGIAPPEDEGDKSTLFGKRPDITCPKCNSKNTKMVSQFGSTACKSLYKCNDCHEPFEYFKCLK